MNNSDIVINRGLTIPTSEITFRFSTSSGPGGQHANKSETRVTLLFDVAQSPSLSEGQRALIQQQLGSRLDSSGVLQISVQDSRSQHKNRETAVARFQSLLATALRPRKKRRKTRPSRSAQEKRLQSKKRRGQIKRDRGRDWSG
jgi:ribosome-associated protein